MKLIEGYLRPVSFILPQCPPELGGVLRCDFIAHGVTLVVVTLSIFFETAISYCASSARSDPLPDWHTLADYRPLLRGI